ncbi:MAG TPA: hypothetical protein VK456_07940 [Xanthobacteraceae bacterium]|nr:hypothetical protein [Xanthobacteraceae bacterium]
MARRPLQPSGALPEIAYSSGLSAVVFTLFVAAGSAYIVLAKLSGMGALYVTFVPVAIMLAYALLIWLARSLRLRDDQAGDNLYYMGFLFTLTSLGVSLYQFNAARAAEEIVQNFGIAIGSTISGIALRVIFNQMRHDPVEVERTMRLELAEAARRVRRELDSTVVEFGYLRRSAQQAAADSFAQVAEKFDEIARRLLASMDELAAKSAQPLDAAAQRSGDMVRRLAGSAEQLAGETERLSQTTGEVATRIDEVARKLADAPGPGDAVAAALTPVVRALGEAVDRFTGQLEGQSAAAANMLEAAKLAAEVSAASIDALRADISADSAANRGAVEAATGVIAAMTQILDEYRTDARDQAERLRGLLARIDGAVRALTERRAEVEDIGTRRAAAKREAIT